MHSILATAVLCTTFGLQTAAPQAVPAVDSATPKVAEDTPKPAPPCATVGELLDAIEKAGAGITSLTSGLSYEKFDGFLQEAERRFGRVVLAGSGKDRRFAFLFDRFLDGQGREETLRDHWLFADGWLAEINSKTRTFTKRQIVEPGKVFDPLKLGEGPFPLPLGQARSEVEARFVAELCEVPEHPMLSAVRDVCGLRLTPKPGSAMAAETERVEVFYDRATLAPRAMVLVNRNQDRTTVSLPRPVVNQPLSEADQALLVMPEPDPRAWAIDIRPWEGPKDESALSPRSGAPRPEAPNPGVKRRDGETPPPPAATPAAPKTGNS